MVILARVLREVELDGLGQRNQLFDVKKQVLGIAIVRVVDPQRDVDRLRAADVQLDSVDHLVVVIVSSVTRRPTDMSTGTRSRCFAKFRRFRG